MTPLHWKQVRAEMLSNPDAPYTTMAPNTKVCRGESLKHSRDDGNNNAEEDEHRGKRTRRTDLENKACPAQMPSNPDTAFTAAAPNTKHSRLSGGESLKHSRENGDKDAEEEEHKEKRARISNRKKESCSEQPSSGLKPPSPSAPPPLPPQPSSSIPRLPYPASSKTLTLLSLVPSPPPTHILAPLIIITTPEPSSRLPPPKERPKDDKALLRFLSAHNSQLEFLPQTEHGSTRLATITFVSHSNKTTCSLLKKLQSAPHVVRLKLLLDYTWTEKDLVLIEEKISTSNVSQLLLDGCNVRTERPLPKTRDKVIRGFYGRQHTTLPSAMSIKESGEVVGLGTRFDPLIRLMGRNRNLSKFHPGRMPEFLKEFSVPFPKDLSHLQVLQIPLNISDWSGIHGKRFYDLIKKCTHLKRLILECCPDKFPDYLSHTQRALEGRRTFQLEHSRGQSTLWNKAKLTDELEVQFFTQGQTHVVVLLDHLNRIKKLSVNLKGSRRYEVAWLPISNSPQRMNHVNDLRLDCMTERTWLESVKSWIERKAGHDDPHIRLLSLDCRALCKEDGLSWTYLFDLLAKASSQKILLGTLILKNVHLDTHPLPRSHPTEECSSRSKSLPKLQELSSWGQLFQEGKVAKVEEFYLEGTNFGDRDIETLTDYLASDETVRLKRVFLRGHELTQAGVDRLLNELQSKRPGIALHTAP